MWTVDIYTAREKPDTYHFKTEAEGLDFFMDISSGDHYHEDDEENTHTYIRRDSIVKIVRHTEEYDASTDFAIV